MSSHINFMDEASHDVIFIPKVSLPVYRASDISLKGKLSVKRASKVERAL